MTPLGRVRIISYDPQDHLNGPPLPWILDRGLKKLRVLSFKAKKDFKGGHPWQGGK